MRHRAVETGEAPACMNCEHFTQHYRRDPQTLRYCWVNSGHCSFPRLKHRRPYEVCEHHKPMAKIDFILQKWVDEIEESWCG